MAINPEVDLKAAFERREARADAVDERVRDAHDAEKAKNEWAARIQAGIPARPRHVVPAECRR